MLDQNVKKDSFIIGLFCGNQKPGSASDYLEAFVKESKKLQEEAFIYNEVHYNFKISSVICDAPARAFVKNVKSQILGDKCTQHREWNGKITFPDSKGPLRDYQSFNQMFDEDHHLGPSPFTGMYIGMVPSRLHAFLLSRCNKALTGNLA